MELHVWRQPHNLFSSQTFLENKKPLKQEAVRIRTARDGQQFDSSAFHSALAKENDKDLKWGDWSMILLALVCACVFLCGMEGENDKLEKVKIKSQFNFGWHMTLLALNWSYSYTSYSTHVYSVPAVRIIELDSLCYIETNLNVSRETFKMAEK